MSLAAQQKAPADRSDMIREAFRLEYVTLAWMSLEAVVAIGSGLAAQSLVLVAFGLDSLIELASAGVLVWRLIVELRHGQKFAEAAEQRAARIGGALLFALAAYVVLAAGWKLCSERAASFRRPGWSYRCSPSRSCITCREESFVWPTRSAAVRCAPMRSRASPAAGSPSSWWRLSPRSSPRDCGGSIP
jgi:hypothetical protein